MGKILVFFWVRTNCVYSQAAQRGCGCPVPAGVQGQVGWGPGQPSLVLNVKVGGPACGGGAGASWSLRSLPTQAILWFTICGVFIYLFIYLFIYFWKHWKLEHDYTLHINMMKVYISDSWFFEGQEMDDLQSQVYYYPFVIYLHMSDNWFSLFSKIWIFVSLLVQQSTR